jgi:hypothetical protein
MSLCTYAWPLMMEPIGCSETPVTTKSTLRKITHVLTAICTLWRWDLFQHVLWTETKRCQNRRAWSPLRDESHAAVLLNNLWLFSLPYTQYSRPFFFFWNCAIAFYARDPGYEPCIMHLLFPRVSLKSLRIYTQHVTSYLLGGWHSDKFYSIKLCTDTHLVMFWQTKPTQDCYLIT